MLYFDNSLTDVESGERARVVSVMCPLGLYLDDFQRGLDAFKLKMTGEVMPPNELELKRKVVIANKAEFELEPGATLPQKQRKYGKKLKFRPWSVDRLDRLPLPTD